MAKLVLFGAGVVARIAHHYFTTDSEHEVVAFTVHDQYREGAQSQGLPLVELDRLEELYPPSSFKMFVALSYAKMNSVRANVYYAMKERGYELVSYVSSRCTYLSEEPPGDNCFILENNTIQPFVRIGNNVTLWSGNHIGHDSVIDDHSFITSHVVVSGFTHVKSCCFIGVNATLGDSIVIGERTLVGAGTILMKDTEPDSVYVPPRPIRVEKNSSDIII